MQTFSTGARCRGVLDQKRGDYVLGIRVTEAKHVSKLLPYQKTSSLSSNVNKLRADKIFPLSYKQVLLFYGVMKVY